MNEKEAFFWIVLRVPWEDKWKAWLCKARVFGEDLEMYGVALSWKVNSPIPIEHWIRDPVKAIMQPQLCMENAGFVASLKLLVAREEKNVAIIPGDFCLPANQ